MFAITIMVAVTIAIPFVPVFKAASISFPITVIESLTVMARPDPPSALIRRPGPITPMPSVTPAHGIPITFNPYEFRSRTWGKNVNHARSGRRTNSDTDRDLRAQDRRAEQKHRRKQSCSDEIFHLVQSPLVAPDKPQCRSLAWRRVRFARDFRDLFLFHVACL